MRRARAAIASMLSAAFHSVFVLAAVAQSETPATRPSGETLPAEIRDALRDVTDFSFSYDGSALTALLRHVRGNPAAMPGDTTTIDRWADLLERPADFRGVPVRVSGIVGRNSSWRFQQPERSDIGTVFELQIRRDDQPIICKLVFTQDAGDIPLGSTVVADGYFLTIQQFYGESNRPQQAAVLVGVGPTSVAQVVVQSAPAATSLRWLGIPAAAIAGLFVAYLILKRAAARPLDRERHIRASRAAPLHLGDDLAAWANREAPGADEESRQP